MNSILTSTAHSGFIERYSFRYFDNKRPVYFIERTPKHGQIRDHFATRNLYTTPIWIPRERAARNALLGFSNEDHCAWILSQGIEVAKEEDCEISVKSGSLKDLKYLANVLHVPLIVIMNAYCDIIEHTDTAELFFHLNRSNSVCKDIYDIGKSQRF